MIGLAADSVILRNKIEQLCEWLCPAPKGVLCKEGLHGAAELRLASICVENAAYNLATRVDCDLVAEMIVIAADIDRLVGQVEQHLAARSLS